MKILPMQTLLRVSLALAGGALVSPTLHAQTTLTAGDVAIIGYNASGSPDTIALLFLKELSAGTTFYVCDNEVEADGGTTWKDTNEAEATFTVLPDQTVAAGTVVILPWGNQAVSSSVYSWTGHTSGGLGASGGTSLDDGVYIYTGTTATATPTAFIYYLKGANTTVANGGSRPGSLVAGETAITPASNATRYKTAGAVYSGTKSELLTAIGNIATNWEAGAPGAAGDWTFTVGAGSAQITIDDVSVLEGNSGTTDFLFTVTRSNNIGTFSVDFATADGTATTADSDYVMASGTLNFTAGSDLTQTVTVAVNGDVAPEPDETFSVILSNVVNSSATAVLSDATGTGTVLDEDTLEAPQFTQHPADVFIASGGTATLTCAASGIPAPTLQWYLGLAGDTSNPIIGETGTSFTTPALTTTTRYWVRATNSVTTADSNTATVAVGSNEANLSDLTLSTGGYSKAFSATVSSYVQLVPNSTANLTVTATTVDANASLTIMGAPATSGAPSASLPLNEGINLITISVLAENEVSSKTYTVQVVRQSSAALATGAIAFTGFNADGNDNLAFVALTEIPANTVIVMTDEEWTGTDWDTNTESSFLWLANSSISAGTIVTIDDLNGLFPGMTTTSNLGTIIGIADSQDNSGLSATADAIFAFQSTGALNGSGVPVPTNFLAVIGNDDEVTAAGSLTGTGLATTAGTAILIDGSPDGLSYTGARTGEASFAAYLIALADTVNNWQTASDGTTLLPFDTTAFTLLVTSATVAIDDASIVEGNSGTATLTLTVTRSNTATAFTVDYAVTASTATDVLDYTLSSGTLTFTLGGPASLPIDITVNGDTAIEANETITVGLSNLVNSSGTTTVSDATGVATITNDDVIPVTYPATNAITSTHLGTVLLNGAEIPAYHPATKRAFASSNSGIQVVDLTDPTTPVAGTTIDLTGSPYNLPTNDVSSVTIKGDVLAAAIIANPKTSPGVVVFIDISGAPALLGSVTVGANPDNLTFTPDGAKVLVAIEAETAGEPSADTTKGGVDIINVAGGYTNPPVTSANFDSFDVLATALSEAGVRIFPGALPSTDFEPEYIAVAPDGLTAMVTLQEANAVAVLDIATGQFTAILPLGLKDFSGYRVDVSDKDGAGGVKLANPTIGHPVFGMYQPDAIASFQVGGNVYYIMANEGDDRNDFMNPDETTTVGNAAYVLDPTVFPDAATLKTDANLGRLTVCNVPGLRGDTNDDGDIDQIISLGGRSFTIVDAAGNEVFESGDMIEMIVASQYPAQFDDGRSDNKGPEPEGVTVATLGGRTYAFVGLERSHMVLAFDVTNPASPTFATAFSHTGDLNPEGLIVIPASDSPNGQPLLLVANESSNTLTVYQINVQPVDFNTWLAWNNFTSSGFTADSNNDGKTDGFAFFFNASPSASFSPNFPVIQQVGSNAEFSFNRLTGVQATGVLEYSTDLANWAPASLGVDYTLVSETENGAVTNVKYQVTLGSPVRFWRLQVNPVP